MCLIVFSFAHPNYRLVIAANRDEFYARQTAPAAFWNDHPSVLGGRDLEAMGTWMGINKNGKIAMVTNYRDLKNLKSNAPSRGKLVSDYLLQEPAPEKYLKEIEKNGAAFNGFNLLLGDADALWYYSNYREGIEKVSEGVHGLSNRLLDTAWPKVKRAEGRFEQLLKKPVIDHRELLDMLYDDQKAPDAALPDTGVGLERERMLSSVFIKSPNYGSRCSTVITVGRDNHVVFTERVYLPPEYTFATRSYEFETEPAVK